MNTAKLISFPAKQDIHSRSNRMENKKLGHFSLFRSLLSVDWAKDTAKLALWVRLLGEASYRNRVVEFAGKDWSLNHGQLVTTTAILARKLRDQDGKEKSPQAVTRMLNFFTREGMITTEGNRFGTVITITNYTVYQAILPDEPSDKPSDKSKASNGAALRLVPDEPSDELSDEQNKKVTNKNKNNKPPKSPKGESNGFDPLSIPIPEWLDKMAWEEWVKNRAEIKKPMKSERTVTAAFKLLKECLDEGHNPADIINTSIANGYQGLFKPKFPARKNLPQQVATQHWNDKDEWENNFL